MENAFIAASAAIFIAYLTQFTAEQYRRFRDGSSIAAGIAGELSSYKEAPALIRDQFAKIRDAVRAGCRSSVWIRPIPKPTDLYLPRIVDKIGILGPELCEQIVFVYANLEAFRAVQQIIMNDFSEMNDEELLLRIDAAEAALSRAHEVGSKLIPLLHARTTKKFFSRAL